MVLSFPVVTFGLVTFFIGGAAVLMPMVRSGLARSRRRRRSKNRKKRTSGPRQRIDLTAPPPQTDRSTDSSADTS